MLEVPPFRAVLARWSSAASLSCPRADLRLVATREASVLADEASSSPDTACLLAIGGQDDKGHVVEHVEYLVAGRDSWQICPAFRANATAAQSTPDQGRG